MSLALFDFDGTITTRDSLIQFIKFAVGKPKFYMGLFSLCGMLAKYKLGIIPNDQAKESLISYFFKGWDYALFQKVCDAYSLNEIDRITRTEALDKITWHKSKGHRVVVVSASMENWLAQWCASHDLELIGTQLEVIAGKLTGKFATKNCYGAEKLNRVRAALQLDDYRPIYAYGDSAGDKDMLAIADKKFFCCFSD